MTTMKALPVVYISGQCVEPGLYRDAHTGVVVQMIESGELPEEIRLVRRVRRFYRVDKKRDACCTEGDRMNNRRHAAIR